MTNSAIPALIFSPLYARRTRVVQVCFKYRVFVQNMTLENTTVILGKPVRNMNNPFELVLNNLTENPFFSIFIHCLTIPVI